MTDPDRYLATDGLRERLGQRSARSAFIRIGGQAVNVGLMLGTAIVLARLLTPRDFGLYAMVNSLIVFAGTFKDWGFPMATVHIETIDNEQVSALFWLALKLNAVATALIVLAAPLIAWFYGEPQLTWITVVMAAGYFGIGLGFQHESLLMRQMRFGTLMLVESGALVVSLIASIGAASLGAGYWALVLQFVVYGIVRSAAAWWTCGWRPVRSRRHQGEPGPELGALLAYSRQYVGYRVIHHAGRHIDRALLGYFHGATTLGYYESAFRWSHHAIQNVYLPLQGVAVASFSRLQHDPDGYRAAIKKGMQPILAAIMPALVFMALEAPVLIPVVFGERWLPAVVPFQLLCISAFATSVMRLASWIYLSRGDTRRQLRWAMISTPFMIVAVAIGIRWGAVGVSAGVAVVTWLLAYPTLAYCLKGSPIQMRDLLGVAANPVVASAAATVALLVFRSLMPAAGAGGGSLAMDLVVFGLAYVLAWLILPGGRRAVRDVLRLVTGAADTR